MNRIKRIARARQVLLLAGCPILITAAVSAQTVSVWLTNDNQKTKLVSNRPSLSHRAAEAPPMSTSTKHRAIRLSKGLALPLPTLLHIPSMKRCRQTSSARS